MKKILKYDFLDNYAGLLLINAIIFFCSIGIALISIPITLYSPYIEILNTALYSGFFIGCFFALVFIVLAIFNSMNKKLFFTQGYLTFSLPISIDAILLPKIFINLFWLATTLLTLYVSLFLSKLFNPNLSIILIIDTYTQIFSNPFNSLLLHLNLFITSALFLVKFLFILSLLNIGKIKKYRFIIGVLIFAGIEILLGIFKGFFWIFLSHFYTTIQSNILYSYDINNMENSIMLYGIKCIQIIIFYLLSRYLIKNKLELE
ncbi:hypothetical protein [Helicobacter sp. 13S00477-4]|uniref:hypothetical protein n=1 Tax=Helicobacter sp. 13S00477-4 TaxID=1905759 RepID=UPI000BA58DEF|nr:hypothetical protein [Helicobacter sp. 13S00477-4]PAF51492.1 hypothetical protein BKH44_05455 [Helicobacter sp. 13S00477-4]